MYSAGTSQYIKGDLSMSSFQIYSYTSSHAYIHMWYTLTVFWSRYDLLGAERTLTYHCSSSHCYHVCGVGLGLKYKGGRADNVLVVECTVLVVHGNIDNVVGDETVPVL